MNENGSRGERVAINAATQASLRPSVESDLGDVWCSRCEQPSVIAIGKEVACAGHAVQVAAERVADISATHESTLISDELHDALKDLERALGLPISNPSPTAIAAAERAGGFAL